MAAKTGIAWCDATFNPWIGCRAISPGCANCYAKALVERWGGNFGARRVTSDANWRQPLLWAKKARAEGVHRKVFCASLADVFEDRAEVVAPRDRLWGLIMDTIDALDWLLVTKRPENFGMIPNQLRGLLWLIVTAEDQPRADARIPILLRTPARVRGVSCEPLLGPVDPRLCDEFPSADGGTYEDARHGIHWIICGGESGPGARPMHPDWARSLRDQCAEAGIPFFMKQMAKREPIPDELMIRQFPEVPDAR